MEGFSQEEKQKQKSKTYPYTTGSTFNDNQNSFETSDKPSIEKIKNKAFELHSQGNVSEAAKYYQYLIKEGFKNHIVYSNYGVILRNIGKISEAEILLRKAIQIKPNFAIAHYNLGNTLKSLGRSKEAEVSQRKAIELDPNYAQAYLNLGLTLKDLGQLHEAKLSIEKAVELNPDYIEAKLSLETVMQKNIPRWHIPMINDKERNSAYLIAIKNAIKNNESVIEIGTGSGLLSMMAIDAGAKEVSTCEMNTSIAEIAKKIISKNGYDEQVNVINKKSTEVNIGKDIKNKADVLISEIFSSELVGEGVQTSILDAKNRLLRENGKMIPEAGEIKVALLESSPKLKEECFAGEFNQYDLSDFNQITGKKFSLKINDLNISYLSQKLSVFSFDFKSNKIKEKDEKTIEIQVNKSGICLGLITWMKVNLYQNIYLENDPSTNTNMHWSTPIYTFEKPLKVVKDEKIKIKSTLLKDKIWFELMKQI